MLIAQQPTACDAFHAHTGKARQRAAIVSHIAEHGGEWSIGEIAHALGLQKSTVSARIWECLNETGELAEKSRRKDRRSGITVRPVGLPVVGQQELFQ
jgi:DNA-binding IclR family transcriptional regulator